ncbi:MAG: restriction endonuclease subunit R, partial [Kiritimatiellae bacterium]|nr:restriction endonuclease subunit R [Kiritimatiellia bacterium]
AKKAESDTAPPPKKEQDGISEAIENNATKELVQKRMVNPAFFERMSKVLKLLIEDRKAGVIEYRKLLEEYRKIAEQIRNPALTGRYPPSIADSPVKQALYDNFGEDEKLALALHKAFLGSRLQGFKYNLAKQNKIKAALWNILQDDDKVEAVYRILAAQEVA